MTSSLSQVSCYRGYTPQRLDLLGTYQYLNTTILHTGGTPISYPGDYATDLLANRSLAWIDAAAEQDAPFFIAINPVNPHANLDWSTGLLGPPIAAPRYQNLFPDVVVPRSDSFNPDVVRTFTLDPRSRSLRK